MTRSSNPLRVGVIGVGRIARDWVPVVLGTPAFELVGVVDADPRALEDAVREFDTAGFSGVSEMIDMVEPDAALILTPPVSHADLAVKLFACGVHVLCEKPLALNAAEVARMLDEASRSSCALVMASKFRHVPAVSQALTLIDEGLIGEVRHFDNWFCAETDMSSRWNSDPEISGGGVLIDNGVHAVDLAQLFLGSIVRVSARLDRSEKNLSVEDTASLEMENAAGVSGRSELSWAIDRKVDDFVCVEGSAGTLRVGWKKSSYRLSGESAWHEFGDGYDKRVAFRRQLEDFASVVRGDRSPAIGVSDALHCARVIDAAYRSASEGEWATV
ncbi:MAG: Gfo/Idh/MocA family oxidoreductase [Planctomycetota bacterium]|nr:Gfo/Idh/MocA family oxidoreductase [Planctomycetota bacterium]